MTASHLTTLYCIRHGETDWNVEKRFQGQRDIPLNKQGKRQAEAVAAWITRQSRDFKAIYTSDLSRCVQTAEVVNDTLNLDIVQDKLLREIACGDWEGLSSIEIEEKYPGMLERWRNDTSIAMPNGESVASVQKRMIQWFTETVPQHIGEDIVMISHGAALTSLFAYVDETPLVQAWNDISRRISNTGVTTITVDHKHKVRMIGMYSSTSHLTRL